MKLFQQLLIAPAALGLLAPLSASATEVNLDAISNYSEDYLELDANSFQQKSLNNVLLSGGEGLVESSDFVGGFSETTTASFSADFLVGAVDGSGTTEAATFGYQMGIGLETSFTGEDSLSATIDIGNGGGPIGATNGLNFDSTSDALFLDGLTYTFPLGGATVMVGDNTDISAVYTGACAYSSFTDYMGNCGTGNSVGIGGKGVTAAVSYAFDGGFSLAGGVSSEQYKVVSNTVTYPGLLTEEGTDIYGIEAAYTADSWGVSVAYADDEAKTYWGVNGTYAFDFATLSAGIESEDSGSTTAEGFFVGLSFADVGAGSLDIGMGTTGNFADTDTDYYIYEASYAYPVNDGMTITPGIYIREGSSDETGFAVKTSFSF
jgi:hypothetical protein